MLADALGRPLRIMLTGGEVHDSKTALALLENVDAQGVIADKAYDSNDIRNAIVAEGMAAVIPSRRGKAESPMTTPSTKPEIESNAASISSNIFAASQPGLTGEPSISSPSSISPAL